MGIGTYTWPASTLKASAAVTDDGNTTLFDVRDSTFFEALIDVTVGLGSIVTFTVQTTSDGGTTFFDRDDIAVAASTTGQFTTGEIRVGAAEQVRVKWVFASTKTGTFSIVGIKGR